MFRRYQHFLAVSPDRKQMWGWVGRRANLRSSVSMKVLTQFPAARDYEGDLRFRTMFEGAAIGIGICQLDGRILEANPALSRMLGYSREELAGTNARELYPERRREVGP